MCQHPGLAARRKGCRWAGGDAVVPPLLAAWHCSPPSDASTRNAPSGSSLPTGAMPCVLVGSVAVPLGTLGSRRSPTEGCEWGWGVLGSLMLGLPRATVPIWDGRTCTPGAAGKNSSRAGAGRRGTRVRPRSLNPLFSFHLDPLHGGKDGAQGKTDALSHAHVPKHRGQHTWWWWCPLLCLVQPAGRGNVPK